MKIKSNALAKFLVPLVILGAMLIGVKTYSTGGEKSTALVNASNVLADLTPDDLKAMGIEGDTPQDTLRTLVGSLKMVTTRQNQLDADNKALADESKTLKQADQDIDERINQAIAAYQANANKDQGQLKGQVQEMTIQIGDLMQKLKAEGWAAKHIAAGSDIPVGLGLASGGNAVSVLDNDSLQWTENLQWSEPQDGVAKRYLDISAKLLNAGLQPVNPEHDVAPLNGYLRALPMCFNPDADKNHWYSRLTFVQHFACLLPVFGRDTGTGHPGFSFFNRGGAPLTFDPLNKDDRTQNAHLLLFGPTGSGKSATLCSSLSQLMAVHRPRLFLLEAGNSFGLFADYCSSLGLTVNKISVKPGKGVSLAPFADAHLLLQASPDEWVTDEAELPDIDTTDDNDGKRDILGEMEITARLMVTGGEAAEEARMTRADRGMLREAILAAARTSFEAGRQMLPEDLMRELENIARDNHTDENGRERRTAGRRARAEEMSQALRMFTGEFEGELFNRPGTPWPEADVTLIDLGTLAREGYEAQMAVAVIALVNTVNNIAERDQYLDREINMVIDEAHIVTTNPLLSPYMTKVVKMWRKLGAWLWLATQNLADYPDTAEKMLNMAEWWLCLTMPPDEVEQISRFKKLTEEQKTMLLSATKLPRCYTEGVVLAKRVEALFRAVPPSLYLALGMTEKEEKAERRQLMTEHNCSELEAAFHVARKLDRARGMTAKETSPKTGVDCSNPLGR